MSINSHQEQIISDTQRKLLEELLEQLIGMRMTGARIARYSKKVTGGAIGAADWHERCQACNYSRRE